MTTDPTHLRTDTGHFVATPPLPRKIWNVNGRTVSPLDELERKRQLATLKEKESEVEWYLTLLQDDQDAKVDAIARCMNDFEFFVDHFVYTIDPRDLTRPSCHFILYDFQRKTARDIIACIRSGKSFLIDKSRDMGATWIMMAIITWMWLFDESFHALIGSRKEDLVDSGSIDDLYGKIDFILERLPSWMLNGYEKKAPWRKQMMLKHPASGNVISGESANTNFGRGPRKNLVYLDEYAFWESDRTVWQGIQDTAPCKAITSTCFGEANMFAELRFAEPPVLQVFTLHWTLHPCKNEEWYNEEVKKRKDKVAIAQELDIDYKASAGGLALPLLQRYAGHIIIPAIRVDDVSNENAKFYMGLDYGSTNPTSLQVYRVKALAKDVYDIVSLWEYFEPSDIPRIATAIKNCPYYNLVEEIYADPSMWFYNQNTAHGVTSLAYLLRDNYQVRLTPGRRGDTFAREQLTMMWSDPENIRFHITEECPEQIREFQGLRFETQTAKIDQKKNAPERLVDKNNHSWDAFKYFFNSKFSGPIADIPNSPTKMGIQAMNEDLANLKKTKLEKLATPPRRRRRFAY